MSTSLASKQAQHHLLQPVLADLLNLGLLSKHVHWNVTGPRFRALHLQLDEIVDEVRGYADAVAERAVTLGVTPDGRASTICASSLLHAHGKDVMPSGAITDSDAVELVNDMLTQVIAVLDEAITATSANDPVTQDLFIQASGGLQKQRWMLTASR